MYRLYGRNGPKLHRCSLKHPNRALLIILHLTGIGPFATKSLFCSLPVTPAAALIITEDSLHKDPLFFS